MRGRRVGGTASENELTLSKSVELMFRAFYVPPINAVQRPLFLSRAVATARRARNYNEQDVISSRGEPPLRHSGVSKSARPGRLVRTAATPRQHPKPGGQRENNR